MHTGHARQLGFKMQDGAKIGIVLVDVSKGAPQQLEQFGLVMIALRAKLDQLDEVTGSLRAQIILANTAERILEHDFGKGVQVRFPARRDRDLRFKKKIELAGKGTLGAARPFGDGLNTA